MMSVRRFLWDVASLIAFVETVGLASGWMR
jgi:hypothetical protein